MPAHWFDVDEARGKIKIVFAKPDEGLEGKESVARNFCSVARQESESFSYAASSWMRASIVGISVTSDVSASIGDCIWPQRELHLCYAIQYEGVSLMLSVRHPYGRRNGDSGLRLEWWCPWQRKEHTPASVAYRTVAVPESKDVILATGE